VLQLHRNEIGRARAVADGNRLKRVVQRTCCRPLIDRHSADPIREVPRVRRFLDSKSDPIDSCLIHAV
jgi:hypothetical protein